MSVLDPSDVDFYVYCKENVFTETSLKYRYQHWFVLPAVLILVMYIFLEKRKNVKKAMFGGRPAPVKPFSFLDEHSNRWGIMLVFGSITGNIIQITQKTFSAKFPIWAKIFLVYILCLEQCVICYPMFASMTNRHKLVGAIVGLLYSTCWFIFEMYTGIQTWRCLTKFQVDYTNVVAHQVIQEFPLMVCRFLLIVKFCHKLYTCIKKKKFKVKENVIRKPCSTHQLTYVRHLLRGKQKKEEIDRDKLPLKDRLKIKILRPVPGFRYPISIIITVFMSTIMLYMVGLFCAESMELIYKAPNSPLGDYVGLLNAANTVATIATFCMGFRNIYIFTLNYKRDILLLLKGKRSFIPVTVTSPSPNVYMARGMRFIGTAIVGALWGTVCAYLVIFVPLGLTLVVGRVLDQTGQLKDLFEQFQWLLYPVCMIIIFQIQVRLIGWFFIQPKMEDGDRYKPLAVDNRNVYDILTFFMMFLNASIGLFVFLRRILTGALLGVFLISRMDRSLLMVGYEGMDKCYVNYIGMLMVDVSHNNPTMRVFCHILQKAVDVKRGVKHGVKPRTVENPVYTSSSGLTRVEGVNTKAKRRWFLAYTLIKNPKLTEQRKWNFHQPDVCIDDIQTSVDEEKEKDKTGHCVIKCCRDKKCSIPPNITTNLVAMAVLLMFAFLYAGVPILLKELNQFSI